MELQVKKSGKKSWKVLIKQSGLVKDWGRDKGHI